MTGKGQGHGDETQEQALGFAAEPHAEAVSKAQSGRKGAGAECLVSNGRSSKCGNICHTD